MPGHFRSQTDEWKEHTVGNFAKGNQTQQKHATQGMKKHQAIIRDWIPGAASQKAGQEYAQQNEQNKIIRPPAQSAGTYYIEPVQEQGAHTQDTNQGHDI